MADARSSYNEQFETARQALGRGDRQAAAAAFRSAIALARADAGLQRELVPALVHLGKLEQELGRPADAERLLTEALEIGERHFGVEHLSLGPVLNELSRLRIRQSDHARAEVLLERLLRITRTRGEEHPDVATALTGLALVKRALGDHAAAEQRFRDALRIRETALAPEHMATVVTMEQLSETCAARGNLAEALALLQRALPTREAALGSDHATVRALRSRIAALEHRAQTVTAAPVERQPAAPVERQPAAAAARPTAPSPEPPAAPAAPERVVATSYPAGGSRRKRIARFASAGVLVAAIATAGMTVGSRAGGSRDERADPPMRPAPPPTASSSATPTVSGASATDAIMTGATTNVASTAGVSIAADVPHSDSARSDVASPAPADSAERPVAPSVTPHAPPKLSVAPKNLAAVTTRLLAKTNVDSMVGAATKVGRELSSDQIGSAGVVQTSSLLDDASAKPASLIGPAPAPRFPDELRSHWTEGEVVLRFRVDERGRVDVSSVKVLKSDHDAFTAAVRSVLPRFRFEPAHSAAPQSKPVADWVDYRVRFVATK